MNSGAINNDPRTGGNGGLYFGITELLALQS
jgi:hypothetical protein